MFHLGLHYDGYSESRKYAHFFCSSLRRPASESLLNARMLEPARYFTFGTRRDFIEVTPEEMEDITLAMKAARLGFLAGGLDCSPHSSDMDMRSALGQMSLLAGGYSDIHRMDTQQVTQAVREAVEAGYLIFVPEADELRACVKAIREDRQKHRERGTRQQQDQSPYATVQQMMGKPPRMPSGLDTPPGNAQPFGYQPDMPDGDAEQLAASTNNPDYAAKMLGYDRDTFGKMIHVMKDANDLGGADNVIWHDNGDVFFRGNWIDNMHNY